MSDPAVTVSPQFQSAITDAGVAGELGPNEWNESRKFGAGSAGHTIARDPAETLGAVWVNHGPISLMNRTGAALAAGDVVKLDSANDASVVLGDTLGNLNSFVVAAAAINSLALGRFARAGVIACLAQGAITRGDYVKKSATSKAVETTGTAVGSGISAPQGSLGIAVTAAAGSVVTVYLFGQTVTERTLTAGAGLANTAAGAGDTLAYRDLGAKALRSTDQSINDATLTAVLWTSEAWDTDTIHDNATNTDRLTCKTAGKYLVVFLGVFASNATGRREFQILDQAAVKVGQAVIPAVSGLSTMMTVTAIVNMAVNDWVQAGVLQTSGGALNFTGSLSSFSMQRIG